MKKILIVLIVIIIVVVVGIIFAERTSPEISVKPTVATTTFSVVPDSKIVSPLKITGKIAGTWFFEASFPIILVDWDGKIIAQTIAKATSDWMTTDLVPFEATLEFTKPSYGEKGAIIFKKDNPSGLPANDKSIEIPVRF